MSDTFQEYQKCQRERQATLQPELERFIGGRQQINLEIGCGHGKWLTAYAEAHPEELSLGIDLITKRIQSANKKREKSGVQNVAFLKCKLEELWDILPPTVRLAKLIILFPDPWPKTRHHKNRIIQDAFLDTAGDRALPGARLYFRTDHTDYFSWTQAKIVAHPKWDILPNSEWPFEQRTHFQDLAPSYASLVARRMEATNSS